MTNQFDLNKFNSFLDKATQAISCDSNCQKEKTKNELKSKYLNAESNLTLAEPEFELAKKKYYTYVSGENGYNEIIEKELEQAADQIIQNFKEKYQSDVSKIKSQLETYNGLLINYRNVVDLHKKYTKENNQLYKQFKKDTNDILTNERKSYYEDQQNTTLNSYYYYVLWTIYIITVICFIVFSLVYPSQSGWQSKIILMIVFLLLPFISTWILGKTIYIIHWIFGFLPKNVYM